MKFFMCACGLALTGAMQRLFVAVGALLAAPVCLGQTGEQELQAVVDLAVVAKAEQADALLAVRAASKGQMHRLEQIQARNAKSSPNMRALLALMACSADPRRRENRWATECLQAVSGDYPDTPVAEIARQSAASLTPASEMQSALRKLQDLAGQASQEGVPGQLAVEISTFLQKHSADPDVVLPLMRVAETLESRSESGLPLRIYERLWKANPAARRNPVLAAEYADSLNLVGRHGEALEVVETAQSFVEKPSEQIRLEFSKALALRDLHRMNEAQRSLDKVLKLARLHGEEQMVAIVEDLRQPGHSMDQSLKHSENRPGPRPEQSTLALPMGLGAILLGLGVWVVAKLGPRKS